RPVELRLHGPAERHRVALRHVRAHDDEAVGVLEIARIQGRRAAAEPCPQTGDARAVSYPGLILDGDDAEPAPELLADVVELVVERRATEREQRGAHVDDLAVDRVDQGRASDRAEWANARRRLGVLDAQLLRPRHGRRERHAEPDQAADRGPRASAGRELQEITPTDLHGILPA